MTAGMGFSRPDALPERRQQYQCMEGENIPH